MKAQLVETVELLPHPSCAVDATQAVAVDVSFDADSIVLAYRFPATNIVLPPSSEAARADDLWRHTCAEFFVAAADGHGYREFNFSPAGHWAAYDFRDYRQRTEQLPEVPAPLIHLAGEARHRLMTVTLDRGHFTGAFSIQGACALTMVLEDVSHKLSYWALRHTQAQPDFHHRDGFVLTLN